MTAQPVEVAEQVVTTPTTTTTVRDVSSGADESPVVLLGNRPIATTEIQRLMRLQGLDRALATALVLDEAASAVTLPAEEVEALVSAWHAAQAEAREPSDQDSSGLDPESIVYLATRQRRIELFQIRSFQSDVELRFLDRKLELDEVVYSLIRTDDHDVALELYQRVVEGEDDFETLAAEFSSGSEQQTGGRVGPHSLMAAHPELSARLRVSQEGQLWEPFFVVDIWVLLRLEQRLSAQLDEAMRQTLLAELFNEWVMGRVNQLLRGEPLSALPLQGLS